MTILDPRTPVTVLTGFLGSGKTTLLNRLLTAWQDRRVAVIINDFGETGIDARLLAGGDADVVEMDNGCVCCTVRGDLIRTLGMLLERGERFAGILIETSGLATPAPVAQAFFVDEALRRQLVLDAIVTVVDGAHVWDHLETFAEIRRQVAFADVILLNKIDLAAAADLDRLETRLRMMNLAAPIYRTCDARLDMGRVLEVRAFDLGRVLDRHPEFLTEAARSHDPGVMSAELVEADPVAPKPLGDWLRALLARRGSDIYRMKGLLNVQGESRRVVVQGVHALFDGAPDRAWRPDERRENRLVFIGRCLDVDELRRGFRACLA